MGTMIGLIKYSYSYCKMLRSDKVKEHEETPDHLNTITLELEKENTKKCSENYNKDSHKAIADAVKSAVFYNLT